MDLYTACKHGDLNRIKYLVEQGADITTADDIFCIYKDDDVFFSYNS